MKLTTAFIAALLLCAGCASYDGRGLAPGQATESDIVKLMGQPSDTRQRPNGDKALYYSRLPYGREMFVLTTGPDGRLKTNEQVLNAGNIKRIQVGATGEQVRDLLGPPSQTTRAPFKPLNVWEYPWRVGEDKRVLWVAVADDGVVREVTELHDFSAEYPQSCM
jgi:outer membrane protein assembly factor BamE (lipoprotein component of BamABCDE complex)